jgi:hypothetical protein
MIDDAARSEPSSDVFPHLFAYFGVLRMNSGGNGLLDTETGGVKISPACYSIDIRTP